MTTKNNSGGSDGIGYVILTICLPFIVFIGGVYLIRNIIGIQDTDRVVEKIPYTTKTIYTEQLTSGVVCEKPEGKEGTIVKEYKTVKHFGKETSKELISEEVTAKAVNGVKVIGTAHKYTGYCSVEGTYRQRYAECYGDYSPQALQKAEEQAYICNTSAYNESGCYDTYYSSIWNGTKTCADININEL